MSPARKADRERWVRAALDALEEGGPAAVAVVPIARALGVTRGSFYWHFHSRDDLLRAALELWEREHSDEVLEAVESIDDPRERLRALLGRAGAKAPSIYRRLLQASDDPLVADVLERVGTRRLEVIARAYRDAGLTPARARDQALLLYAAYTGLALVPGAPRGGRAGTAFARHLRDELIP